MPVKSEIREDVVIKFAGDSGDGMQLTGGQFTSNTALFGNDMATFPDFPAEIRAPQGTLAGVSGFQIQFGSREIHTPGDRFDVLVAMNAAALKTNLNNLKPDSIILVNTSGFDAKNLRLANYENNPIEDETLSQYRVIKIDVTRMTRDALEGINLGTKEKDRSKNMFVLGFLYWMYNRDIESTRSFLEAKFSKKPEILEANIRVLKAGYNFGNTTETFTSRYDVQPAKLPSGNYRSVRGNEGTVLGLIAASHKSGLPIFLGSYPITPASDILHNLAKYKNYGVRTFQAEDEIAAVCSAIGASYGGSLGITTTSGPGMALKTEAMGLAVILELPLVVCDIQRAGPSTGMPTKTEQSDLLQAIYGRNGESPLAVIAAASPSDAFMAAFEACRIAVEHMTPVVFLSDGYIANGAEPWRYPDAAELPAIKPVFAKAPDSPDEIFMPYKRRENLVRPWAVPGVKGLEHRIGGLEKEDITGNVSYDPENHQHMVKLREKKIANIAFNIPEQHIEEGPEEGDLLVLGWGSTFGAIKKAVSDLNLEGYRVSHAHLRYIRPFPRNLGELMKRFDKVLIPEINNGQLIRLIRDEFLIPAIPFNKIMGIPITSTELYEEIKSILS